MASSISNGALASQKSLSLTEVESNLKSLLLDVAAYINPDSPSVLRFTGGWVRDKLLGVGSHDIDVAINNMTGWQFGLRMKEYLEIPGNLEKYKMKGLSASGLHKIEANPEKSKHLETVTTNIFGLDIDLVNLRKETYSDDSRNPQMEFGTPEEDALRRDATVNAMFYNLQEDVIEDFTGQGHADMKLKILRTPLEPYQTFKDDPLRILRLIRFASRLDYSIDPAAEDSMKDPTIKEALRAKISRERVGVEIDKMLKGPNPALALSLIDKLDLYETIFTDPTIKHEFRPDISSLLVSRECAGRLLNDSTNLKSKLIPDKDSDYQTWLFSAFTPYADAPQPPPTKKGKLSPPHAVLVAREGIKATNKVCSVLEAALKNLDDIIATKDYIIRRRKNPSQPPDDKDPGRRDVLGMKIRLWGESWKLQIVFALIVESIRFHSSEKDMFLEYESFIKHIEVLDLLNVYDLKPLVDGKQLSKALDMRPGPWMKDALEVVMAYQLRNPSTATSEAAIAAVREKNGELTASLVRHFLSLTIRPLFAKTQTHDVTPQGRKATSNSQGVRRKKHAEFEGESTTKPWKDESNESALTLLSWSVKALNAQSTEENWPFLIPPILALVDDHEARYKIQGCTLLVHLFQATQPSLLKRTGLGAVFNDAITPCLSYLPTLTPEDESIPLLNASYTALFALIELWHTPSPIPPSSSPVHQHQNQNQPTPSQPQVHPHSHLDPRHPQITTLDKILHEHLLPSISHVFDTHPHVLTTLLHHLRTCITTLRLNATAHIPYILPLLTSLYTLPFAAALPALVLSTTKCLQAMLAMTWPRMHVWRGEIYKSLFAGWLQVLEEEERWGALTGTKTGTGMGTGMGNDTSNGKGGEKAEEARDMLRQLAAIKQELRIALKMLVSILQARAAAQEEGPLQDEELEGGDVDLDVNLEVDVDVDVDVDVGETEGWATARATANEVIDVRLELERLEKANVRVAGLVRDVF